MGLAETQTVAARVRDGIGQALVQDREPTNGEISDVLALLCGMAVNLARIAERP